MSPVSTLSWIEVLNEFRNWKFAMSSIVSFYPFLPLSFCSDSRWDLEADEKQLENGNEIPEKTKKLAAKAKDACERLLKDGSKLVGHAETQNLIKDGYKTLSNHINNLNNLLMFSELPDKATINAQSLENFIGTIARDVDQYHGEIQAAKARAKAKS